jgi:hypothetical protein
MAYTSAQTAFNLDLTEIVEEAFERCGSQLRSGYDLKTAIRSLNLISIEWANRGINLWTMQECNIPLVTGQVVYPVPADTIDILNAVTRTNNGSTSNQIDINLSRISEPDYSSIPNKLTTGRPIQVWFNRQSGQTDGNFQVSLSSAINATATTITLTDTAGIASTGFIKFDAETIGYTNITSTQLLNCTRGQNDTSAVSHLSGTTGTVQNLPCLNIYPAPSAGSTYNLIYWRMRRIQDAGGGVNVQDIPFRFINCMVAALAYFLSIKIQGTDPNRVISLKADYEEQFGLAAQEDRDKAALRFVPRNLFYSR